MRFDNVDRAIALTLIALGLAACGSDSTSPTPVATGFAVSSGAAQVATVGTLLPAPVVVKVTDQSGNPISGVVVSFSTSASSGTASSAQATTDATGSASVTWTLGTIAGADSMTVTAGSLAPMIVVATATAGAPASLTIVAGNNQTATADSPLGTALSVKVADQYGNAIGNATVQWSDDAGGTFSTTTTVTDANGIAQVQYTLGAAAGPEDVTATLMNSSASMSTTFLETGS